MPFFVRTGRLDIKRLETTAQANLEVVHSILTAAVKEVIEKRNRVERAFYGPGKSAKDEVFKWVNSVKAVMATENMKHLNSSSQMDELFKKAIDPNRTFTSEAYDLNRVKECYRKVMDAVPAKLEEMIKTLRTIFKYLEKYCLSFYNIEEEGDLYLDTAHNYEIQRRGFKAVINDNIERIYTLPKKFRKKGLFPADLSSYGIEIGRKGDCLEASFLLIFPEAMESLRTICSAVTCWIDADANYSLFILNDVKDFEAKKNSLAVKTRDNHQKYHQLMFRLKQQQALCEQMVEALERLAGRESELLTEEEAFICETNEMQLQIERKEYRRDELIKNAAHMHPQVLYERYNELCEDLRDLKLKLPFAKRELAAAQYKLGWIGEKREALKLEEKKMHAVEDEVAKVDETRLEDDVELENVEELLRRAREIYLFKSCPDAVEKIFNNRPVEVNKTRLPGNRGKDDLFEQVCDIVASAVDNDWPRLYRALPFHPARGETTIDNDIREFSNMAASLGTSHITRRCLNRWRRFHTRAKLDDLNTALRAIKREDILHTVDLHINPPRTPTPPPETFPDFLDEYLIPFWKDVEKFDLLRAANKI